MSIDQDPLVLMILEHAELADAQKVLVSLYETQAAAARALAAEHGVSDRTGRRWMSQTPASRVPVIMGAVTPSLLAAQVLRRAQAINVGTVAVAYRRGKPQGTRTPGRRSTSAAECQQFLHRAASALESQDLKAADAALSDAVMTAYEPGLEETLTVDGWDQLDID